MTDKEIEGKILEKYGAEAGGEILRLSQELFLMSDDLSGSATFWRQRYFELYDQLSAIADVVGAPRASNYEGGHVLAAVKEKLK